MGTLLISSLIIFPSLTAMRVFKSFKGVVVASALISVFSFVLGLAVSYFSDIATGASIVLTNAVLFVIFFAVGKAPKRS